MAVCHFVWLCHDWWLCVIAGGCVSWLVAVCHFVWLCHGNCISWHVTVYHGWWLCYGKWLDVLTSGCVYWQVSWVSWHSVINYGCHRRGLLCVIACGKLPWVVCGFQYLYSAETSCCCPTKFENKQRICSVLGGPCFLCHCRYNWPIKQSLSSFSCRDKVVLIDRLQSFVSAQPGFSTDSTDWGISIYGPWIYVSPQR